MKADADDKVGASSKPVLLHLVGGGNPRGGLMSYVRQLLQTDLGGIRQCVWKHVEYTPENENFICLGNAKTIDVNILTDLRGAVLDFLPLYRWIGKHPNSILYAHSRAGTILTPILRLLRRCPVLIHVHGHWRQTGFHRLLWRLAKATVIFNSPATCRHFGVAPQTAHIHMPTIRWPNCPEPGEGSLVACGAILPIKNTHLIIEAFNAAGDAAPRSLHIYGFSPEPLDPGYQQRIVELAKKNPRMCLHDWDERWSEHLGYNDIFIHASRLESFGIVMLEAFAKGCRMVVAHDTFLNDLSQEGIFRADLTAEGLAKAVSLAHSYRPPSSLWEARRTFEKQFALETTRQQLCAILCPNVGPKPRFRDATELSQKVL
ncbi:MAG: glycosyltransferase family 4 protein [Verrucomicrobiota bacterium]|jgi:glycosyltransferase involved in cell wall biosynthesis